MTKRFERSVKTRRGEYDQYTETLDIAPTLVALLHTRPPAGSEDRILSAILQGQWATNAENLSGHLAATIGVYYFTQGVAARFFHMSNGRVTIKPTLR
jgi:hypothetical protein